MKTELLQILAAGFSGIGFAMIFHIRPRHLPVAFGGAALSWLLYLGAGRIWDSRAIAMMAAAFGVTVYSEIAARVVRMPVSVIYTPAIIPLIPGSHLYYCMRAFVTDSRPEFLEYGSLLLEDTLSIVLGSMIVLTFVSAWAQMKNKKRTIEKHGKTD
ncbi:MAG: threonine/serine exporter family protein [Anaerolineaceae bacterium]|nr:threonine/serine exporter family protein [Anaerolineaceae bacterium]